jgi:hypothetical protein
VTAEASAPEPVEPTPAVTEEAAVSEAMEAPLPPGPEDPEAPLATPGDESAAPAWPWDALGPEPVAAQAEAPQGAEADEASAEPQPEVEQSAAESESDFILDLDAIQPVTLESGDVVEQVDEPAVEVAAQDPEPPAPTPAPAPVAEVATSMAEYTCDDCVYVETCPNQGQRLPKDCGSFQWR